MGRFYRELLNFGLIGQLEAEILIFEKFEKFSPNVEKKNFVSNCNLDAFTPWRLTTPQQNSLVPSQVQYKASLDVLDLVLEILLEMFFHIMDFFV